VGFPQFIAAIWLALICALAPAHAEKRVALVIGNGAYLHADKLSNPVNDSRGVRNALKQIGFDVTSGENLDQKTRVGRSGTFAPSAVPPSPSSILPATARHSATRPT
jgi:hypothetical protein